MRLGTRGSGEITLKCNINAKILKKIHISYSNGEIDMTQTEWEHLDKIDTLLFEGRDLLPSQQAFVKKLLKRVYDRSAIV